MALAPFFERVYGALGGHLAVSRESLNTALENIVVGLRCGDDLNQNDLWIAELSTKLIARIYPRLLFLGPEKYCSTLQELALKINPNIEFATDASGATIICVGAGCTGGVVFPSANGWVAHLDHSQKWRDGPTNPYAAGAAAALACAEVFRRIFLTSAPERDIAVSLLNFDTETGATLELAPIELGDVLFVGVGAVGNGALWPLARDVNLQGKLWLVDSEEISLSNLQRYVLTTYADVDRSKVLLGKQVLANSKLSVDPNQMTLEKFVDEHPASNIPVTVVSVDNVDGRRSAQALLPRLVINGWTGDQALGASWHVLSRDAACLACLYHPHKQGSSAIEQASKALGLSHDRTALLWVSRQPLSDDDLQLAAKALGVKKAVLEPWRGKTLGDLYTDVVCGAVPLDVTGVGKIETVPLAHQSAFAGILMAAELVKRSNAELSALSQAEVLVSWDDVLREPPAMWAKPRAREKGCICGDEDYREIYRRKWESTIS